MADIEAEALALPVGVRAAAEAIVRAAAEAIEASVTFREHFTPAYPVGRLHPAAVEFARLALAVRDVAMADPIRIGAEVGGHPDAYPVRYKILSLKDGAVLKLTDAFGQCAEVALSAGEARVLALGLLGALPALPVSGLLGADDPPPGVHHG
jgi:hypothetical protein